MKARLMVDLTDIPSYSGPKAFVTGWPITHSRSPMIHGHWLNQHGLAGSYSKIACAPEEFEKFITTLEENGFVGGNVTMPHKEGAFACVEKATETAKRMKAVNTVWMKDGVLHGDNTDGYGFAANLDQFMPDWDNSDRLKRPCLVLGAGGAARAVVDALFQRGFSKIILANRTVERAETLLEDIAPTGQAIPLDQVSNFASEVGVIINTTSIGMEDGAVPMDLDAVSPTTLVSDIVYTPIMTPLLKAAAQRNLPHVDGLGMLLHQAVPGFVRWFGVRPIVDAKLRTLIVNDLEKAA